MSRKTAARPQFSLAPPADRNGSSGGNGHEGEGVGEVTPFQPRYLNGQQLAGVYGQALAEAEAAVAGAWMNHVLNPHDRAALARYEMAAEMLDALVRDSQRFFKPEAAAPAGEPLISTEVPPEDADVPEE